MAGQDERRPLCFAVMWFDRQMDDVHDTIKGVAEGLGFECRRADDVQHVEEISAKIRDLIRESVVVVADLTGSRPNVYYEVGYAHALGKPVVLTMRAGEEVNFDLRQFNTVHYATMRELRSQLKTRMEGAVGRAETIAVARTGPVEVPPEHQETLELLNKRIEANPDDPDGYASRALVHRALGNQEEAYRDLQKALDLRPSDVRNHINLAHYLNGVRRFEEALEVANTGLALDPVNSKVGCLLAYALNGMRRYEEAARVASEVLQREPENPNARRLLEVAQKFARDSQPAERDDGIIATSPVEEYLALAYSLNNTGEYERALEVYDKALALAEDSIAGHIGRGYTLNRLHRPAEALSEYDEAVRLDPSNGNAHIQRGFTLNGLARNSEAAAAAREGLRLDPGNRAGLRILDTALRHMPTGRPRSAATPPE